jgi:hypothetical protein
MSRPRAVAINVGANTTLPGFRGPVRPDGRFAYVPIPEREPTAEPVPIYADLSFPLPVDVTEVADRRVHLDPEFAGVHGSTAYTYGDEHGVKAGPLSALDPGDSLFFTRRSRSGATNSASSGRSLARRTANSTPTSGHGSRATPTSSARRSTRRCWWPGARIRASWIGRCR